MNDRRNAGDRRSFRPTPSFPFTDMNGCFLRESRSRAPDRRLNSLSAEWISMALVHDHLALKRKPDPVGEAIRAAPLSKNTQNKIA
jgi:hypothetical protein